MLLKEFYEKIGGDYDNIKGRLGNDDIIKKFVLKFLNEKSYEELMVAAQANDVENSLLAAHKMKGVVANLSFDKILKVLTELLAWLRQENQDAVNMEMIEQIKEYYQEIISAINELDA